MTKKSLRKRFQELAGIHKTLIQEQVIEGQWINFSGGNTTYNPNVPGGQGINLACVYGCMDPDANNYNPDATCWGDANGVMSVQSMGDVDYNGIAYGPSVCTYGYSCDTIDLWHQKLYELGLANQQPPFNITPDAWPSSVDGFAEFFCGGEPGSDAACAANAGVCHTGLQYNPGQFCPACSTQYDWGDDGTGTSMGTLVCDCCCPQENENPGCTDQNAVNYDSYATTDDGSCLYDGCTDPIATNFDPNIINTLLDDDGSCEYHGCTDPTAINYSFDGDPFPAVDPPVDGPGPYDPTEPFNGGTAVDDGSCEYPDDEDDEDDEDIDDEDDDIDDEDDEDIDDEDDDIDDEDDEDDDIDVDIDGCMDPEAANYNPNATIDYTGPESPNFDEFGCVYLGCMDDGTLDNSVIPGVSALNYDPNATFGPPNSAGMLGWSNEVNGGGISEIPQCIYPDQGCVDNNAVNYDPEADVDDGSCYYETECYLCEYSSTIYGAPGELITEIFYINPNVSDTAYGILNSCPQEGQYAIGPNGGMDITDDWSDEPLDCGGGHTNTTDKIECYQCEYPWPPLIGQAGEVVSQIFYFTLGVDEGGCPEDWFENVEDLETNEQGVPCGPDPFDPFVEDDPTRWKCKVGSGECFEVPYDEGVYDTEEECYEKGHCGEERIECYKCRDGSPVGYAFWIDIDEPLECPKGWQTTWEDLRCTVACYKCKGTAPVGYMFDDPPGCPKGWQETYEDLRCNECEDNPLIDIWLNHPQVVSTHCCQSYFITGFSGPQCYENWEEIGGDPNFDPHECCPGPSTDG